MPTDFILLDLVPIRFSGTGLVRIYEFFYSIGKKGGLTLFQAVKPELAEKKWASFEWSEFSKTVIYNVPTFK